MPSIAVCCAPHCLASLGTCWVPFDVKRPPAMLQGEGVSLCERDARERGGQPGCVQVAQVLGTRGMLSKLLAQKVEAAWLILGGYSLIYTS